MGEGQGNLLDIFPFIYTIDLIQIKYQLIQFHLITIYYLQYNQLRRELNKTGGGVIKDDMYLTKVEEAMLDYVGVEGVLGR